MRMAEIQAELFDKIIIKIDEYFERCAGFPTIGAVIEELTRYFTFDELIICKAEIHEYIESFIYNWRA